MTQFTITLPDSAQHYSNEQIATGCYATVDEVVIALILVEKKRLAKQTLNAMIREELVCGEPIAVTPEWWEQQRSRYDSGYLLSSV